MTANCISFLTPTTPGEVIIDVGFAPTAILFLGGHFPDAQPADAVVNEYVNYFGVCGLDLDGNMVQAVSSHYAHANGDTILDSFYIFTDTDCLAVPWQTNTTLVKARCTGFTDNGFKLNFSDVDASNPRRIKIAALQLTDSCISIRAFDSPDLTVGQPATQKITGLGWQPSGAIFLLGGKDSSSNVNNVTVGFDDGINHCSNENALDDASSGADTRSTASKIYSLWGTAFLNAIPGVRRDYAGYVKSFDPDGYTIKWDVSARNRTWIGVAFFNCDFTCLPIEPGTIDWDTGFTPDLILADSIATINGNYNAGGSDAFILRGAIDQDLGSGNVNTGIHLDVTHGSLTARAYCIENNDFALDWHILGPGFQEIQINSVSADSVNVSNSAGLSIPMVCNLLAIKDHSTNPLGTGNPILDNDMELAPGDTHYMTFGHRNKNVPIFDWTAQLFKNGQVIQSQALNLQENPLGTYTWSFLNDGTDNSQWTLVVYETAVTNTKYTMTWKVRKRIVEQTVKMMRNQMQSTLNQSGEGGYIGGQNKS